MTPSDNSAARLHRQAGERAEAATLWDDAVRAYEAALSSIVAAEGEEDEAALLTALGRCYWNMSEASMAWRTLRRAIALYRERGDGTGMARATLEILRIWGPPDRQAAMTQDALDALGDADPYLRARLLMRFRWREGDSASKFDEAMAIAEQHQFGDLLLARAGADAWNAYADGRPADFVRMQLGTHEQWVAYKQHDDAAATLRAAGFTALEMGDLDGGYALALRTADYARGVHLRFTQQLGLVDAAGVPFARGDFIGCEALLSQLETNTDFRADLYRLWMIELGGDTRSAVAMMVNPERAGRAPTAMSQTHGGAAGVLYRAGNEDAARHELQSWHEIARRDDSALWMESPALADCIVALGDDRLVGDVAAAFETKPGAAAKYSTLQGRALAPARGMVLLRLGRIDEAAQVLGDGEAWCERERCTVDRALCHVGLADVAEARGDLEGARAHLGRAAATFEVQHAQLWLDRLVAARAARY